MWQQFKAQKAMDELDAEFNKPAPVPEPKVVERVVERVRIVEKPVSVAVVQLGSAPAPVIAPTLVSAPQPSMVTAESEGYLFKFGLCKLTHRNIKCQLTITSVVAKGKVDFSNVDKSTNSISMFELSVHNYVTNKASRIKFQNVPLSIWFSLACHEL